jgi:DNA-binding NarL/FixJ family response regulator
MGGTVAYTRKVVVYCDDPVNLAGLRAVLGAAGAGPTVPCTAVTDLPHLALRERADVLLIDDSFGAIDPTSLHAVTAHAFMSKFAVVLVVAGPRAAENALRAAHAGVLAVAHRSHDPRLLAFAVASARSGRRWLDPQLAVEIILGNTSNQVATALRDRLTPRENQILDGMRAGLSNAELAATICISARTVKFHVSNVLAKLGARSREQAIAISFARPHPVPATRTDPVLQTVGDTIAEQ